MFGDHDIRRGGLQRLQQADAPGGENGIGGRLAGLVHEQGKAGVGGSKRRQLDERRAAEVEAGHRKAARDQRDAKAGVA